MMKPGHRRRGACPHPPGICSGLPPFTGGLRGVQFGAFPHFLWGNGKGENYPIIFSSVFQLRVVAGILNSFSRNGLG